MAKSPPTSRLVTEDFKDQADWIDKLLVPINTYFERNSAAMNKGLTIDDNFAGAIKTVELDGTFPVRMAWTVAARPVSVLVGNVQRSDGSSFVLANAVQVQWTFNQAGQLQIESVVGITPTHATKYKLTLEIKAG